MTLAGREDHLRAWLKANEVSTCTFAQMWWKSVTVTEVENVSKLERYIQGAEGKAAHKPVLFVFPYVRTEHELHALTEDISSQKGWQRRTREKSVEGHQVLEIEMTYTSKAGFISCPIGLAPVPAMPPTRRAPWVALAMWLYGKENLNRKDRPGFRVSLGDAPSTPTPGNIAAGSDAAKVTYRKMLQDIRSSANTILYPEITEDLYDVTFRVSATDRTA